jgi:hypothetical protein
MAFHEGLRMQKPIETAKKNLNSCHNQFARGSFSKIMTSQRNRLAAFNVVITSHSIFTTKENCLLNILSTFRCCFLNEVLRCKID